MQPPNGGQIMMWLIAAIATCFALFTIIVAISVMATVVIGFVTG